MAQGEILDPEDQAPLMLMDLNTPPSQMHPIMELIEPELGWGGLGWVKKSTYLVCAALASHFPLL